MCQIFSIWIDGSFSLLRGNLFFVTYMNRKHVSYVNLVDTRTFNDRQTIRVCPIGTDQHISGMAFSPDSQSLFVGNFFL